MILKRLILIEWLKMRKSLVVWSILGAYLIGPLMSALFMLILKDPEAAQSSGLLAGKAQLAGKATWTGYFHMLSQISSIGGIIVFGFLTSWVFGREFSDRTMKDLIALPFPKGWIVVAKTAALFICFILISLFLLVFSLLLGFSLNLPGWSAAWRSGLNTFFITTVLVMLLSPIIGYAALKGKGTLMPIGLLILLVVFAQIIGALGYGAYFPWSIPALYSGINGEALPLGLIQLTLIIGTSLLGIIASFTWWKHHDHVH